ncbi:hypothetical protein, partial [Mesorhizobium sp. M7A.F.Ca.CA.004.04.2.1]|uniref:hypothetical protein n=1 Tax=Mesorhizobium sp. M7A.F.Ca.CA.004.04.2.1 TaxID=2496677 RepID=UPI0019D495BC
SPPSAPTSPLRTGKPPGTPWPTRAELTHGTPLKPAFCGSVKSQTLAAFVASKSPKGCRASRSQGGGAAMAAVSSG